MRAIQVAEHGGPETLALVEVDEPEPGPGEVRIRIAAAGVNYIDVYFRAGITYPTKPPFTPGVEAAGVVDALGEGVDAFAEGDRVAFAMHPGAYAEAVCVPAERVVAVPDGVELKTAAAAMLQGMTAQFLARSTCNLGDGDRVLIHAAAGGVGHLLVQVAKMQGATVFATAGSEEKARIAKEAGADEVIRYDEVDFAEAVAERAGHLDVVYDGVGRATFDKGLGLLRPRGLMVLFGQASGPVEPVDPQRLNAGGSLYLTRPTLAHYTATREELLERSGEVFGWISEGALRLRIGETHPLADAAEAHRRLEGRETTGKVLLIP